MTLISPAAAVTDLLLGLTALALALRCRGQAARTGSRRARWYTLGYGALALGSLIGFVTLGFQTGLDRPLFLVSRFAIGVAVLAMLSAVVEGLTGLQAARPWRMICTGAFVAYYVATLFSSSFLIFIGYSGTALLATLGLEAYRATARRESGAGWMAAGMATSIIAAVLQAMGLSFTLVWLFDRNAVYHMVQGVALLLLYRGIAGEATGTGAGTSKSA